jgi:dihydropteroate synthase
MKSAGESNFFSTNKTLNVGGRLIDLRTPRIMGVLNVTPDSFYADSRVDSEEAILNRVEIMLKDGATFLDIGGYSTRPGAKEVPVGVELERVTRAVHCIVERFPEAIISVDTFRSSVARAAAAEGAALINDVSGGSLDPNMLDTVAALQVPYILMHMRGTPETMSQFTQYENLVKEVTDYLHRKIALLQEKGLSDIIVDPGFGFAKTATQNFELLHHLDYLRILNKPILVGLSRKSMVWRTLSITAEDALNGTTVLNTVALLKGASILRVHDVKEAAQIIQLTQALSPSLL